MQHVRRVIATSWGCAEEVCRQSLFSFWMFEIHDCCLKLWHIFVIFSSSPQLRGLCFGSCCQGWSLADSHVEQVISQSKHHCVRSGWLYREQGWVTYRRRCHSRALTFNLLMFLPSPSNGRPWQTTSRLWSLDLPLRSRVRTSELIMMFDHSSWAEWFFWVISGVAATVTPKILWIGFLQVGARCEEHQLSHSWDTVCSMHVLYPW